MILSTYMSLYEPQSKLLRGCYIRDKICKYRIIGVIQGYSELRHGLVSIPYVGTWDPLGECVLLEEP